MKMLLLYRDQAIGPKNDLSIGFFLRFFSSNICLIFLFLLSTDAISQHRYPDEWWPVGMHEYPNAPGYGNAWIHFLEDTPVIHSIDLRMNFEAAVAVGVDTTGQVLFYTNGCEIRRSDGELMPGGSGLNPGSLHEWTCEDVGYILPRSMMALPWPGRPHKWVIFHFRGQYAAKEMLLYGPLYVTEIDMSLDSGKGRVVSKNKPIITGTRLEPFAVVRHGNGRDWWIIVPERGTARYRILLFTPEGISEMNGQTVGPSFFCDRVGSSSFSLDGSRFGRLDNCMIVVMNFDRCTGLLSDPIVIQRKQPVVGGGGLAFSVDNRYLYVPVDLYIFRADLTHNNPFLDSLYKHPYSFPFEPPSSDYVYGTSLTYMQYGPDGRIYFGSRHRDRYYARFIIDGDDYVVESKGLHLPVPVVRTLPHFPNFRLYDLSRSECDTLGIDGPLSVSDNAKEALDKWLLVSPNPVQGSIIRAHTPLESSGWFILSDMTGRFITRVQKPLGEAVTEIRVEGISSGVYSLTYITNTGTIVSRKIVIF